MLDALQADSDISFDGLASGDNDSDSATADV